ncbi:MAG: DUF1549 and DUF1553 domain-containing protein [Prosthecobacter sp.]|nr:DUF1549 and DUF1553 domain-containing protein [Prosthecobacter sp.]
MKPGPCPTLTFLACWTLSMLEGGMVAAVAGEPDAHWAFQPPVKAAPTAGAVSPIDAFLAAEQARRGLIPQPPAEPALWLRRISLDLTGLPPSQEAMAAFEADRTPLARQRVVDRLLESPHYGERWGRHFMDIWRYSDWYGLGPQLRNSQKHIWHWRDWIIESLNAGKGYDRMIEEMLAGDEIAPEDPNVLRATGFLARNYYLFNRTTWLDDVVEHTGKAFLGLTMNCVKCHAHKYDPFTHEDYYAFRAIFEPYHVRLDAIPGQADLEKDGLPRVYDLHLKQPTYLHVRGDEKSPDTTKVIAPAIPAVLAFKSLAVHSIPLPEKAHRPELKNFVWQNHLDSAIRETKAAQTLLDQVSKTGADTHLAELKLKVAQEKQAAVRAARGSKPGGVENARYQAAKAELALAEAKPDQQKAAKEVLDKARATLASGKGQPYPIIASSKALEGPDEKAATLTLPFPAESTGRRTALANWITDRQNPLTARVLVNHMWLRHFGQPLVANVMDLGRQSKAPELQPLLDWLAVEFMESGWDLKHLHRLMVLSEAYAMTSTKAKAPTINAERDPENHFYWHMNPVRMDAQTVRDSLLHLSGQLDATLGGPTIDPKAAEKVFRRSLYFTQSPYDSNLFLETFDNASVLDCYRRAESIVPQQALALMNAKTSMTAAELIATRIGINAPHFVHDAFRLLLATEPSAEESQVCEEALQQFGSGAKARAALVHTLLNHHDFITIR